jgi:anthranilate phosphoribosyltransferase
MAAAPSEDVKTSITPLLKRLWHESPSTKPDADEIAAALALIFTNSLSEVQTGALLTCLHFTDLDRQAEVLAKCSKAMRDFSTGIDVQGLEQLLKGRFLPRRTSTFCLIPRVPVLEIHNDQYHILTSSTVRHSWYRR